MSVRWNNLLTGLDWTILGVALAAIIALGSFADDPPARWASAALLSGSALCILALRRSASKLSKALWSASGGAALAIAIAISVASNDYADEVAASTSPAESTRTPTPTPTPTLPSTSSPQAPATEVVLAEAVDVEVPAGTSYDFAGGALLLGVVDVYDTFVVVNLSTDGDACTSAFAHVGERARLEGEVNGTASWFRLTVLEMAPNTSVTVRVEQLALTDDVTRSCFY